MQKKLSAMKTLQMYGIVSNSMCCKPNIKKGNQEYISLIPSSR